jgi:hypothetical protein
MSTETVDTYTIQEQKKSVFSATNRDNENKTVKLKGVSPVKSFRKK